MVGVGSPLGTPVPVSAFADHVFGVVLVNDLTVNGAAARTGDLYASGTISGPARDQRGAFIELTWDGAEPVTVGGEPRTFLRDGDTVTITATAPGNGGTRIALGEVTGTIRPARPA